MLSETELFQEMASSTASIIGGSMVFWYILIGGLLAAGLLTLIVRSVLFFFKGLRF